MFNIEKISEGLYICDAVGLAIVNPVDWTEWVVIDKGDETKYSKIVFGPSIFEQCRVFIEAVFLGEKEDETKTERTSEGTKSFCPSSFQTPFWCTWKD